GGRRRPGAVPRRAVPGSDAGGRQVEENGMSEGRGAEVRVEAVSFSYGEAPMTFDLAVAPGRIVAIMGPSGSGKSTLLSLIAGFEKPSSGHILVGGVDVTGLPPAQRPVSMVFQENNLFAHLD